MENDRRLQARKKINVPICFIKGYDAPYHQAVTHNVSVDGICFESTQIFSQGECFFIKIDDLLPVFEPFESYDACVVQVKWCQRQNINSSYGVGIKRLGKAKIIKKKDINPSIHCCELCGAPSIQEIVKTDEHILLCQSCFTSISQFSEKTLETNITRFIMGNVI
ncbi:PilZ domain-containing protein [Desulfocicer vacuolatum DSM 3385]|uniref:PilZ domain-containing protein n=1 Tax=Desulfocicer vacuolatum DSM 3385 TaxID=1121400 RepID=A0A1W2EMJ4_9BACT|nr:PilZ domain-containing protein [Desulfocicer vacuolatum]SMD10516.1 PilZ domain-containing protein [Desulfocicer vacuolatum DSM 3385]